MGQSQAIVVPGAAGPPELRRLTTWGAKRLEDVCEIDRGRKPLGKGSFGTVYRGTLKSGGGAAAVKSLDKRKMRDLKVPVSMIASEVELMQECSGEDRFVRLLAFVDTATHFFLVLEFCDGGNLEDATGSVDKTGLGERQVARLTRQLLEALAFLHTKSICHRDVKPQNAMLVGGDAAYKQARVKLGDFGLAVRMGQGALLKEKVGTPAFMAPEMHLLPNKSAGYDHKVDMWAAGAVLVFLLANEYAFVDKHGRLLHHQLLRGDLPLWDTDMFSGLFQKVKEAAGIGRKAPTKVARDFVRVMLVPKRQHRWSAARALQHEWFREPVAPSTPSAPLAHSHAIATSPLAATMAPSPTAAASPSRAGDASPSLGDATEPLLLWKDFEEGLLGIESEFQRLAAGVVDAVGSVQVGTGGWEKSPALDPGDDRLTSCVVCFQASGVFSFLCPLCNHTVCFECLGKLPKPECPYCRHEAQDVAVTQQMSRLARAMYAEAGQASGAALRAAVENPVIGRLGEVEVAISPSGVVDSGMPDAQRSACCHFCHAPSTALNHMCPICSASICYTCAKRELAGNPHCPACGDVGNNAQQLVEYLAAGEAWSAAVELASAFPDAISRSASGAMQALREQAIALSGGSLRRGGDGQPGGLASSSAQPRQPRESSCCNCGQECSETDLSCPCCNASMCAECARTKLTPEQPRCPRCGADARSMRLQLRAAQVRDSAQVMWDGLVGFGKELLTPQAAATPTAPRSAGEAYQAGDTVEYFGATQARWIPARLVRANPDGTFDLDCKSGAIAERIRRPTWSAGASSQAALRRLRHAPSQTPAASDAAPEAVGERATAVARGRPSTGAKLHAPTPAVVANGRASLETQLLPPAPVQPEPTPETPRGSPAASDTCESSPRGSTCSAEAPKEPQVQRPYAVSTHHGASRHDVEDAQPFASTITSL